MNIVETLQSLENIVVKHNSLLEKESKSLLSEFSISSSINTQKELQQMEDENRVLQIGIVGRVKAGKSSLINALLFDGKSVLPKAATPMTAALTTISYGDAYSAEVEFFKAKDIENVEKEHKEYLKEFNRLKKEEHDRLFKKQQEKVSRDVPDEINNELVQKAEKKATTEMQKNISLSASFEQYSKMKESGIDVSTLGDSKSVVFDGLDELGSKMHEYVGSNGKYMPFTKSVHIKMPQENLKNIQIVDTPGVNDPVVSREERTRELLKYCDVVFIVSPSGQFMSKEDLELMNRITTKNGIRELYVIASKCDSQLYGSIKAENNGDLIKVLDSITTTLAGQLHATLTTLKQTNPEVGTVYDKLIEQSKQSIIYSSGISQTIKTYYDSKDSLDSNEKHTWGLLVENYPDYFSDIDRNISLSTLEKLININVVRDVMQDVREQKDQILAKRKDEYLKAKSQSATKYAQALVAYIESQVEEILNANIDDLEVQKNKLLTIKNNASENLDEVYHDLIEELKIAMSNTLKNKLNGYFKEAKKDLNSAESETSETYTATIHRSFWFDGSEERTRMVATVRTGSVKDTLSSLAEDVEASIELESAGFILAWRKNLTPSLLAVLREFVADDDLKPEQIRRVIRQVIYNINFPELQTSKDFGSDLEGATGTLKGYEAEEFISKAENHIRLFKEKVNRDIEKYVTDLIDTLKLFNLSSEIFSEYDSEITLLEQQIENKNVILDEFERAKNLLVGLA